MTDTPHPKRTEQHIEVVSTGEHQNHVHVTAHVEIGPRLADSVRLASRVFAFVMMFLFGLLIIASISGCVQPGTVSTGAVQAHGTVLDAAGVESLVNTLWDRIEQWLLGMGIGGAGIYSLAEGRKWLRDRNGKHKPEAK